MLVIYFMELTMARQVIDKDFRYEKKFISPFKYHGYLDRLLKFVSRGIYEVYPPRRVNSIYYDTDDFYFAFQNIEGYKNRSKVRIRFYGDLLNKNSIFLEIKHKNGDVGTKEINHIEDLYSTDLNFQTFFKRNFSEIMNHQNTLICMGIKPKLFCAYTRKYYQTSCDNYRFTIDTDLTFASFIGRKKLKDLENKIQLSDLEILELKYSVSNNNNISDMFRSLPLRVSKNSKYVTGLYSTGIINYN